MTSDRDRLIELIVNADTHDSYECRLCTKKDVSCIRCDAEKFADYLLANDVIVPPCKVGDTVYYPSGSFDRIFEKTVDEILISENESDVGCYIHFASTYMPFENIGKTVFLTKEEAEEKLNEMNKGE